MTILFAAPAVSDEYHPSLLAALAEAGLAADLVETADPTAVDYIIYAPSSPLQDFAPYSRRKAVLILGVAGNFIFGLAVDRSMVMGLAPVVGVPLFLVSYGGSAMLVLWWSLGWFNPPMSMARDRHQTP